jgi:hypothetical protein
VKVTSPASRQYTGDAYQQNLRSLGIMCLERPSEVSSAETGRQVSYFFQGPAVEHPSGVIAFKIKDVVGMLVGTAELKMLGGVAAGVPRHRWGATYCWR